MEIKIVCDCGTKFKFDVEPVHGRMPAPVTCPECGADATSQANSIIQSALGSVASVPAVAPAPTPAPVSLPPPTAAPPAGGLRINRPAAPPPSASDVPGDGPVQQAPAGHPRPAFASQSGSGGQKSPVLKVLTTILVVVCAVFGAARFGYKWFKRLNIVAQVASAMGEAGVDKGEANRNENLSYEDCAVLFIKHTNHVEVADACKAFWKDKLHRNLAVLNSYQEYENKGEYELIAAHNGYVRIIGAHEWPVPEHESLAQNLSQKFGTTVFEWRSEHFADTYHFGVYEQGTRKFHAQMDVKFTKGEPEEIVTTEGNDFAIANGYKPGPEGFKEFNVLDADKITQRLGMKLWDEKEDVEVKGMFLKESGPAMGNK